MTSELPPDTAKHLKLFLSAARKLEKQIAEYAKGENCLLDDAEKEATSLVRAMDKLWDRANKAEIRGHEAAIEQCWAVLRSLGTSRMQAMETACANRRLRREAEMRKLESEIWESRRTDPLYAYKQEIALAFSK